ncbi:hypothetical protein BGZ60DRAFT_430848 [Tricladium varicosporioides]|nr:hypothetical protein BGZ60DRAFT_430848 [Hymenoscyphus varicosporioides]
MSLTTSAASVLAPALTTTFVPSATTCTENRLTMLANREFQIWNNMPIPVPGTTLGDCYPSQFMSSYLSSAGGITQAAFNPLVCPINYSAVGPYTSNYIACCPSGYSFAQPTISPPSDRPAFGGTCYTPIEMATPVTVTQYGSASVTATMIFTATVTNAQAYAYPLEGTAFGVAQLGSISTSQSAASKTAGSSASTTASAASASGTVTYTVSAGPNPTFTPSSITANIGDMILFSFNSGNHSITQSSFDTPCKAIANGFDSGYMGVGIQNSKFTVSTNVPEWFYSKQGSDCTNGMVFALNPNSTLTEAAFIRNAISTPKVTTSSSGGTSTGVKVGVSVGVVAFALIAGVIAAMFIRTRKRKNKGAGEKGMDESESGYNASDHGLNGYALAKGNSSSQHTRDYERTESPRPAVPPKGHELDIAAKPMELAGHKIDPVELHGGDNNPYGFVNENGYPNEKQRVRSGNPMVVDVNTPDGVRSQQGDFSSTTNPGIRYELFSPTDTLVGAERTWDQRP